jgi:hypothetical protein
MIRVCPHNLLVLLYPIQFPTAEPPLLIVRLHNEAIEPFDAAGTGHLDPRIDEGDVLGYRHRGAPPLKCLQPLLRIDGAFSNCHCSLRWR